MSVNVVTLGVGDVLSMVLRRAAMLGLDASHFSPFRESRVDDFGRAFRVPFSRESAMSMASDLRIDMDGEPRVFSPKSSATFDPLHSVPGFSYSLDPAACVDLCRAVWRSDVAECFDLIESDEPAMFLMRLPPSPEVRPQTVYGRLARGLLATSPRASRSFYLMSPSEHGGIVKRSRGFFTMPFPDSRPGEEGVSLAAPYVRLAVEHFASR